MMNCSHHFRYAQPAARLSVKPSYRTPVAGISHPRQKLRKQTPK